MNTELTLSKVNECFYFYNKAFGDRYPYVSELARELGIKTTVLMKFILNNKDYFEINQDKKGAFIRKVYADLKDKVGTNEYVAFLKEKYKNTIILEPIIIEYTTDVSCHLIRTEEENGDRFKEWGNTPEKIEKIKSFLGKTSVTQGGFGDCYTYEVDNYISKKNIELLISQGWEFINYNKNSYK